MFSFNKSLAQDLRLFSAIIEIISNIIEAAVRAVMLFGLSFVGIIQTTSPPTIFKPRAARYNAIASSISKPFSPGSILDTPGAIVGSRQSRSKVI